MIAANPPTAATGRPVQRAARAERQPEPSSGPVRTAVPLHGHRRVAVCVAAVLCVLGLLAVPFGRIQLSSTISFMPAFGILTGFSDVLTAILLFSQARALDDQKTAHLGVAYLVSALAIVPHLMAFPGAVTETPLIGGPGSAVWLWCIWHAGFALCVCRYALTKAGQPLAGLRWLVAGSVIAVLCLSVLATAGVALLPTILMGGSFARLNILGIGPFIIACNLAGLVLVLACLRGRTVIGMWLSVAMLAATIDVVLTLFGSGRFTIGWYAARCLSLITGMTVLIAMLSELMSLFYRSEAANRQLEVLSLTDGLTGIPNRRSFDEALAREWRRAIRERTPLSLLMMDIDFFKGFNDRYGHPAGDRCLQQVSGAIHELTRRACDMVARVGGEEFAMLLPGTDKAGALEVGTLIHAKVAALAITHAGNPLGRVSISIGLATRCPGVGQSAAELVAEADQALYAAKRLGRNRSRHADDQADEPG